MSSTSGIARASFRQASPAAYAALSAPLESVPEATRAFAIAHISSLGELIEIIPTPYREKVAPLLRALYDIAVKRDKCQDAYQGLLAHKKNNSWPAQLGNLSPPSFQYSKEFMMEGEGPKNVSALKERFDSYREAVLLQATLAKKEELDFLDKRVNAQSWYPEMETTIKKVYDHDVSKRRYPAFEKIPEEKGKGKASLAPSTSRIDEVVEGEEGAESDPDAMEVDASNLRITWVKDNHATKLFNQLREDLAAIGYKVLDIIRERRNLESHKAQKKETLKKKADVAMVSETKTSKETMEALVKAEVARQIK
ncbi:hypothetical protein FRC07_014492, partial [Ceratobasidium sp. 392]